MALYQTALADKRRLSHAYILSSPSADKQAEMAAALAAAVLCTAEGSKACGNCRDCRKLKQGIHPDAVIVRPLVNDKGQEKAEIVIEQVRQLVAEGHVLPNESERKIYIIEQAEKMNNEAQNAALKLLEEPVPNTVLILMGIDSIDHIIPNQRTVQKGRDRFRRTDQADPISLPVSVILKTAQVPLRQNRNTGIIDL